MKRIGTRSSLPIAQTITCIYAGSGSALTRGSQYKLLAQNQNTGEVCVRGDDARMNYYPDAWFDLAGAPIASLTCWRFDEPVVDELNQLDEMDNWVEVTMEFSDGTRRWCSFMTPDYLKHYIASPEEPAFYSASVIFVRDLREDTVEEALLHLEENNELVAHTLPLDSPDAEDGEPESEI